jgi:biotin carboxylase
LKKLAILGASYLQLPLVQKANTMGIETHCFAWDNELAVCKDVADYFYPISVLEKEMILEKCLEIKIDGITTIATDICVETISYVAHIMGLISNTEETSYIASNKDAMRKAFTTNNVCSPESITVSSTDNLGSHPFNLPVIVKPTDRSGSLGVTKVECREDLTDAINNAISLSFERRAVIEEFIEGEEVSVECISWQGNHYILAITDKVTTGEPNFVELEHHQPSRLKKEVLKSVRMQTNRALDALQIKFGASHSEFKITKDGEVYIIEVGARMGGDFIGSHLVALSTGYEFLKGVIEVALNQFTKPIVTNKMYAGVYFLSKQNAIIKPWFLKDNIFDVEKKMFSENIVPIKFSNDRSGYLIYQSNKKVLLK